MIPYFDYRPALARMRTEIDTAVSRVLDSGRLILGAEVEAFENEFATWLDVPHAVGVASGTDALILALRALDIGCRPGAPAEHDAACRRGCDDEVLTVANAGVPTISAIRAVGARPTFVDVCPDTLLMDTSALAAAVTPRTRAVIAIHLYGQAVNLDVLEAFCADRGLALIEDCAQAHGGSWNGRSVGRGRISCFSFYPTKNLGAFGDGGIVTTTDPALDERLRLIRMYGFRDGPIAQIEGLNSRLDELQAAMLRVRLRQLEQETRERRAIAARYRAALATEAGDVVPVTVDAAADPVWHLFVVQSRDRPQTIERLTRHGVGYGIHYPAAAHLMPAYTFLGGKVGDLPVTEAACERVLSLPIYPGLTHDAVDRVLDALRTA